MKHKWLLLVLVGLIGLFLDWYTKFLADTHLSYGVPVPVWGDYFQFLLVYNKGALFGFNPQRLILGFPTNQFFFVFNILAIIVLIFYYKAIPKTDRLLHYGIAIIIPGAFGNLLDRILHGGKGVIDFIKIGISEDLYWPIFNFADIYVTIGVGILILSFILDEKRKKLPATTAQIEENSENSTIEK